MSLGKEEFTSIIVSKTSLGFQLPKLTSALVTWGLADIYEILFGFLNVFLSYSRVIEPGLHLFSSFPSK